jgi:AcrR family transcriptional regulator
MTRSQARNRRADAQRSRAGILDAAVRLLNADPDVSLGAIATAAGVTRQTVYAHFPSRQQLLAAVLDRLTEETVAAMDAADPATGPAADALLRLLAASTRVTGQYRVLLQQLSSLPVSPQADHERHAPVADRLKRLILRGQQTGEFDEQLAPDWLVAVTISLAHAASAEVDAGRLSDEEAVETLHTTLLRALGATTPTSATTPPQKADSPSSSPRR